MAEVVERVANLEARFDAHAQELVRVRDAVVSLEQTVDRRFEALEQKVDARFLHVEQRMDAGFAELRTDFRWVMSAIAGAVVTVILAMFAAMFAKGWL